MGVLLPHFPTAGKLVMTWDFSPQFLIQGIERDCARFYLQDYYENRTQVVAGVADGGYNGGNIEGIPVFDLVTEALASHPEIVTSIICSHPYRVLDATREAIESGISQIVIHSEGIPPLDLLKIYQTGEKRGVRIVGVSGGGILIPGCFYCGMNYASFFSKGNVAIINYCEQIVAAEIAYCLREAGLGVSLAVSFGDGGLAFENSHIWFEWCEAHKDTHLVIVSIKGLVGEQVKQLATLLQKTNKPKIVYCFDVRGVQQRLQYKNKGKVVCNQIELHLHLQNSWQSIIEELRDERTVIVDNLLVIPQLCKRGL